MISKWPLKKISDVAYFRNNKRIPLKSLDRAKRQGKHPYYGASGIVDYIDDYIFDGSFLLISEDGENLRTRKTPIAFQAHGRFWVNNHAHILEEKEEGILDYLEYYFSILDLTPYITGAVQPKLNKANLDIIEIPIPPLDERRSINETLNNIRDKIQLNQQINQTLEQMAQAIFKSWFIDFDPVKAMIAALEAGGTDQDALIAAMQVISGKNEDELAKMQQEAPENYDELRDTASLFPSAMQDSELGEIPEGWEATNFGRVSNCLDKHRIPLSKRQREQKKGDIPYYGATSVMDYVDEYIFDGVYLLLGEDGSVLRNDGTPFIQYIWGKSWVNNHAHVLEGTNGVSTEQLMIFISTQNITAYVTGAVQLKLNQKNMNSIPFIKAPDEINSRFYNLISPMYSKLRVLSTEIQHLSALRDTLLPKLLSGDLSLADDDAARYDSHNTPSPFQQKVSA